MAKNKKTIVADAESTQDKTQIIKQEKPKAVKAKKEKKPNKVGKALKESASELKKVTWPSFGKVAKQTGVVLAFVLIFAVVLFGFDFLLGKLFGLLV